MGDPPIRHWPSDRFWPVRSARLRILKSDPPPPPVFVSNPGFCGMDLIIVPANHFFWKSPSDGPILAVPLGSTHKCTEHFAWLPWLVFCSLGGWVGAAGAPGRRRLFQPKAEPEKKMQCFTLTAFQPFSNSQSRSATLKVFSAILKYPLQSVFHHFWCLWWMGRIPKGML